MGCMSVFVRFLFIVFLLLIFGISVAVLGLDIDFLVNGPSYLATLIYNRLSNNDPDIDENNVLDQLNQANSTMWFHIPLIVIIIISSIVIFMSIIGFFGSIFLSYSMLSGYVIFKFIAFIILLSLVLFVFLNSMEDSVLDRFVLDKIKHYYDDTNSPFSQIIDYFQSDLQCCGFRSATEWSPYPPSCCPTQHSQKPAICTPGELCVQSCPADLIYVNSCFNVIRDHLLTTDTVVGVFGIGTIVVLAILALNLILGVAVCILARHRRRETWIRDDPSRYVEENELLSRHVRPM